jgi:23S rRNA (cytosine1962-C5)-methyltransferase
MPSPIAAVGESLETVNVSDRAAQRVENGNLWIFSNEVVKKSGELQKGAWCRFETKGTFLALGYYNPNSLIAGRVVSRRENQTVEEVLEKNLEESFRRRLPLSPTESTRLVFSEADFIPGLVLDYFSGVLVLQSNTAGIDTVLPVLEKMIPDVFTSVFHHKPVSFVVRGDAGIRALEGVEEFSRTIFGDEVQLKEFPFQQGDVRYVGNFVEGQKTGFFLDQRDNRGALTSWIKGHKDQTVLDLFCYSGGWGLAALIAGAANVTFVDESKSALALLQKGIEMNGIRREQARIVSSDVFDYLENVDSVYDVIVADPPAFVKSKKNLPQALRAYEKLNRLAWRRLKPGGLLLSCSCSYHLAESDLFDLLQSAVAKEKSQAHVVFRGGQASDHPILLSMPETRYLKCIGLKKLTPNGVIPEIRNRGSMDSR